MAFELFLAATTLFRYGIVVFMSAQATLETVKKLTDEYRVQCLWFLRPDYYPQNQRDALDVLDYIQKHGDLAAFRKAGAIKQWLLQIISETSAV